MCAWILLCEACEFGEKIYYSNWNNEFYLRDCFLLAHPIAHIPPMTDGRRRHLQTFITFSNFTWLIPNLARWERFMNFTYPAYLGGIDPEEHDLFNDEFTTIWRYTNVYIIIIIIIIIIPIISYGTIGPSFLTMCTRRCLTRHWRHVKNFAYSRNAKNSSCKCKIWELHPLRTFLLPVLNDPYLRILEEVDPKFRWTKFGKNRLKETKIMNKSNFAQAHFHIKTVQMSDKTSIAYKSPILYHKANWSKIWDHYFTPKILSLNFSPNFPNLVGYWY